MYFCNKTNFQIVISDSAFKAATKLSSPTNNIHGSRYGGTTCTVTNLPIFPALVTPIKKQTSSSPQYSIDPMNEPSPPPPQHHNGNHSVNDMPQIKQRNETASTLLTLRNNIAELKTSKF